MHHVHGELIPFAEHGSLGCAICDPVIAIWCLTGGRSVFDTARGGLARLRPATKPH